LDDLVTLWLAMRAAQILGADASNSAPQGSVVD